MTINLKQMSDEQLVAAARDLGLGLEPQNSGTTLKDFDNTLVSLSEDFMLLTPVDDED